MLRILGIALIAVTIHQLLEDPNHDVWKEAISGVISFLGSFVSDSDTRKNSENSKELSFAKSQKSESSLFSIGRTCIVLGILGVIFGGNSNLAVLGFLLLCLGLIFLLIHWAKVDQLFSIPLTPRTRNLILWGTVLTFVVYPLAFIGLPLLCYGIWCWWQERQYIQSPKSHHLVVISSGEPGLTDGTRLSLTQINTIGRSQANSIVLNDMIVSERHALLHWHNDSWIVEDLRSTNGTYLNNERLTSPTLMQHGDKLRIGQVELILLL